MELRHLRYFAAVAEALSFRKAAENLHISQPPLSTQIHDLEQEIGTALFIRHKRTISLTEAGKTFLPRAQRILKEAQKAKADARLASEGKLGTLSIRFISSAVAGTLQNLVVRFKKAHPFVDLDLEQSNVQAILKDVRDGKIDIGFVRTPVHGIDDMVLIPVLRESYYVALPSSHPLLKNKKIAPKDLKEEKLLLYPRNTASGSYDDIFSLFARQNIVPEMAQEAPEQLTLVGLVAAGMGYSIVPECMTKIRVPGVGHAPLEGGSGRTGIAVIAKKSSNPMVKAFLAIAARKEP